MFSQKKVGMLIGEFLGTATLALVALSVANSPIGINYFTGAAVGVSLAITYLAIGAMTGAHINPAVTFGLWTLRKIDTVLGVLYIGAQLLGGLFAWKLFEYLTGNALQNIAGKEFKVETLVGEIVGTFIFTFGIASVVYQGYKGLKAAATLGASLFLGVVVASAASNGVLNPAVAVGIQSVGRAYIVGPFIGALLGMNMYALLFSAETFTFGSVAKNRTAKKKK